MFQLTDVKKSCYDTNHFSKMDVKFAELSRRQTQLEKELKLVFEEREKLAKQSENRLSELKELCKSLKSEIAQIKVKLETRMAELMQATEEMEKIEVTISNHTLIAVDSVENVVIMNEVDDDGGELDVDSGEITMEDTVESMDFNNFVVLIEDIVDVISDVGNASELPVSDNVCNLNGEDSVNSGDQGTGSADEAISSVDCNDSSDSVGSNNNKKRVRRLGLKHKVKRGRYTAVPVADVDVALRNCFRVIVEEIHDRNWYQMQADGLKVDLLLGDVLSYFDDRDNEAGLMKNSCFAYKIIDAFDEVFFIAEHLKCVYKLPRVAKKLYKAVLQEKRLSIPKVRRRRCIERVKRSRVLCQLKVD